MDTLPLLPMFKIFDYLSHEDRISVNQVCISWRNAYHEYLTRRRHDWLAYRQHSVNGGQYFCRYLTVSEQMARLHDQVSEHTDHIRRLTIDLKMSPVATRKHHITLVATMRQVCEVGFNEAWETLGRLYLKSNSVWI